MNLYNIKHPEEQVNFAQAVRQGLGKDQGLFFPETIPTLTNIDELLALPLVERSQKILGALIGEELPKATLDAMVKNAFTFTAPLEKVEDNIYALELFHGPTLAFKDFGGRFMAQALAAVRGDGKITILTATSGDTGRSRCPRILWVGKYQCGDFISERQNQPITRKTILYFRWEYPHCCD